MNELCVGRSEGAMCEDEGAVCDKQERGKVWVCDLLPDPSWPIAAGLACPCCCPTSMALTSFG